MADSTKRSLVFIARFPLLLIGFLLDKLYPLLFSRGDKRLAEKSQTEFEVKIRESFKFLFEEFSGRIMPTPPASEAPPFDWALASVQTKNVVFHFSRDRGSFGAEVASIRAPNDGYLLSRALYIATGKNSFLTSFPSTIDGVAVILADNIECLEEHFSKDRYEETLLHLSEARKYDDAVTRQVQAEINSRPS